MVMFLSFLRNSLYKDHSNDKKKFLNIFTIMNIQTTKQKNPTQVFNKKFSFDHQVNANGTSSFHETWQTCRDKLDKTTYLSK